ncbi:MAG: Arylsulfotransferase [Chthonomonadaceae bacterium]|nr:Arylsulfotransferase [Chthonomonadaceae bacterium]
MRSVSRLLWFVLALSSVCSCVLAQTPGAPALRQHHFMFMQYSPGNRIVELSAEGKILWEHPMPGLAVMFQELKNGDVVYAYGGSPTGVQEVDREHKVVWNYNAKCEQVLGFSRLPNGNILVGEQGPCQAVEVNRKGEEVHVTPLTTFEKPAHRQLRTLSKLSNGDILACHEADATVREVDPNGKVIWEYPGMANVFQAIRLKNGNTLIGGGEGKQARIIEVTKEGKLVWEFGDKDAPELGLNWICGIQILKNGNLVVGNFLRGKEGQGAHAFEITRKKQVVWVFADHKMSQLVTMAHVLDE